MTFPEFDSFSDFGISFVLTNASNLSAYLLTLNFPFILGFFDLEYYGQSSAKIAFVIFGLVFMKIVSTDKIKAQSP